MEGKARIPLARQDYNQGIEAARESLKLTQNPLVRELLAVLLHQQGINQFWQGHGEQAIAEFQESILPLPDEQNHFKAQLHYKIALIRYLQGNRLQFQLATERTFEFVGNDGNLKVETWLLRAEEYVHHQQFQQALDCFTEILKLIDPNHDLYANILFSKAMALYRMRRYEDAIDDLIEGRKANPDDHLLSRIVQWYRIISAYDLTN